MTLTRAFLLLAVTALSANAQVIINEIMYNPVPVNARAEFLELHNTASTNINLTGWRLTRGVDYNFPSNTTISAGGYLVVAGHRPTFLTLHPAVTNVVGDFVQQVLKNYPDRVLTNWVNTLGNGGNRLILEDSDGDVIDEVEYADEGDWAFRRRGLPDVGIRGWTWWSEHDGGGKSLELRNRNLPNEVGQNWAASGPMGGTPGTANSTASINIAPLILDTKHFPPVPRSDTQVTISARIVDENSSGHTVTLYYRDATFSTNDGFISKAMLDDGAHGDGVAGDGLFGAFIDPFGHGTIIDFYVEAQDSQSNVRTWPAAALPALDDFSGLPAQQANALYQVDDLPQNMFENSPDNQPIYKMIMTGPEAQVLRNIPPSGSQNSDAQMNMTFISLDGTETLVRYLAGARNRGNGSRGANPPNYHFNFPSDRKWKGVSALNINAVQSFLQVIGSRLALKAGVAGTESHAVQIRVNGENRASAGGGMFGAYAANESYGPDWAENHFPNNAGGNVYKVQRNINPSEFEYRGETNSRYQNTYFKDSNASEDDWQDLKGMLAVMGTNGPVPFDAEAVNAVINVDQWMRHIAVMSLVGNGESGLNSGHNDDYFMYRGVNDPRFLLTFHDFDQIFGMGGQAIPTNDSIFGATTHPPRGTSDNDGMGRAMNRFLRSQDPNFEAQYYRVMQELLDTTFSQAEFDRLVDETLGGYVSSVRINEIKTYMNQRRASVQSQINCCVTPPTAGPVAVLSGAPRSPTPAQTVTITVSGQGLSQYRWRRIPGSYSAPTPITTPIVLSNLVQGSTNTIGVLGILTNGTLQNQFAPTIASWVVDTNVPAVRLNEVLARNDSAYNHVGTFPDVVELFNESTNPVDISGMRLTDELGNLEQFAFPPGTVVAPNGYLTVFANDPDGTPGLHLGFGLNQNGDSLYLYQSPAKGGALVDSIDFGIQPPDLSLGRIGGGGTWVLTQPSIGAGNVAAPLGDSRGLKINEFLAAGTTPIATDFFEVFNTNTAAVAIGGFYLTDNTIGERTKSRVRDLSFIGPRGFIGFIADGTTNENDHVGFQLSADLGEIALISPSLSVVDSISYGPQQLNAVRGRCPDGVGNMVRLPQATPGLPNWCPGGTSPPPVTVTFVNLTNAWRYNTSGADQGTAWRGTGFNDASWSLGLGVLYGGTRPNDVPQPIRTTLPGPGGRPITYYFRSYFVVPPNSSVTALQLHHAVDDGAIFYINNNDVGRYNMPQSGVTFTTPANGNVFNAEFQAPISVALSNLVVGTNVIAVELHQTSFNNADACLAIRLEGIIATNSGTGSGIMISEILANNVSTVLQTNISGMVTNVTTPDIIELYNPSSNAVSLADASLTDDLTDLRRWVFPAGSVILPRGYLTIRFDADAEPSTNFGSILNTGFGLNSSGDAVHLISSIASGRAVLDSVTFGPQAVDFSISRAANTSSNWSLTLPTLGATNGLPAVALGNAASIRINEWMASPSDGEDWFELYNPGNQPVALAGLYLSDRLDQPNKYEIPPLSFIGYGSNAWLRYFADGARGENSAEFRLSASGEAIGLYTAAGTPIDEIAFGPQEDDVSEGRLPDGAPMVEAMRFPGTASPNDPNFAALTSVVISEVLAHSGGVYEDAIELRNLTGAPINIGNWWLSNAKLTPRKYPIPTGTTIPANGYVVFYEYQFNDDISGIPFTLDAIDGDEVYLSAATNNGAALTGYRALAGFEASEDGVSMGPHITSDGREEFVAMAGKTFGVSAPTSVEHFRTGTGAANSYPKVGPIILTEVMYHPPDIGTNNNEVHEFVELHNPGSTAVTLYDPAHPTNRWRLRGGIDFDFPPNTSIPAGGYLLVVTFDPFTNPGALSTFQTQYGSNSTLIGPYQGRLANSSDSVRLLKPDAPVTTPGNDFGQIPYILVDKLEYGDTFPWPDTADGGGHSLQRIFNTGYGNDPTNWLADVPTPGPSGGSGDSDGDGMPNDWETDNGFNPNSSADAGQDADGDGLTNLEEYIAGTDPRSGSSLLRITSISQNGGSAGVTFNAAAGKTYSVIYRTSLTAGPWTKLADVPSGAARSVTVPDANAGSGPHRFYQLVTPQQ